MATTPTLSENDIRPDHLMVDQAKLFAADVARLLERRSEFVEVDCPACANAPRKPAWQKYEMSYVECLGCGTVYISPRPPPSLLEQYYATSENYAYWNKFIFPASEDARRERIFRPRAERLAEICGRYGIKGGTLLEVGAGFGTFGEEIKRIGTFSRVFSVEPTPDLAATCRRKGLEVIEAPIEKVKLDVPIDVVASYEVIEHLFSPRRFLEDCAAQVRPGGLIVLTCPNVRGFDIMELREKSGAVDVEHLNYFHPASLGKLLGECGFETLEAFTPGRLDAELVRKRVLAGEHSLDQQPLLRSVLLDRWDELGEKFQDFLATNGLSSHMWIVGRRRGAK